MAILLSVFCGGYRAKCQFAPWGFDLRNFSCFHCCGVFARFSDCVASATQSPPLLWVQHRTCAVPASQVLYQAKPHQWGMTDQGALVPRERSRSPVHRARGVASERSLRLDLHLAFPRTSAVQLPQSPLGLFDRPTAEPSTGNATARQHTSRSRFQLLPQLPVVLPWLLSVGMCCRGIADLGCVGVVVGPIFRFFVVSGYAARRVRI